MSQIKSLINQQPEFTAKKVNFNGDELLAIKNNDTNNVFVGINYVSEALGLNARKQRDRLLKHKTFSKGCTIWAYDSSGGNQETNIINVKYLPAWLLSINPDKVKPDVQAKLIEYQEHASEVLYEAFFEKKQEKIKSSTEMLLESVQALLKIEQEQELIKAGLVDTNNKLDKVAVEQQRLLEQRDTNMKKLFEVERSQVLPLQKECKAHIKRLVEAYVKASGNTYPEVYGKLYNEFDDRYNTKVRVKAKNKGVTPLAYIESIAHLEPLYSIASHILVLEDK